jgi:hypothetical protein
MSGEMRTAIMSLATWSPEAHAGIEALGDDVDQAVVDADLDLDVRVGGQHPDSFGHRIVPAAWSWVVMRIVPAGLSRASPSALRPASMAS